jgi:flagellar motility protein MotE (MotC chaperone)
MRLRESFCRAGASPAGQPDAVALQLPNEFLKEHREVQELQATAAQQQKSFQSKLEAQEKEIAVLTSGLRKIDAQFELRKPVQNWYSRPQNAGLW